MDDVGYITRSQDLEPKTLLIKNCDKIILEDKSCNFRFEIPKEMIDQFNTICINGIIFDKRG